MSLLRWLPAALERYRTGSRPGESSGCTRWPPSSPATRTPPHSSDSGNLDEFSLISRCVSGDLAGLLQIQLHTGGDQTRVGGRPAEQRVNLKQRSLLARFGRRGVQQLVAEHLDHGRAADATKMCNITSLAGCKPPVDVRQTSITYRQPWLTKTTHSHYIMQYCTITYRSVY